MPISVRIIDADEARPPVFSANVEVSFPNPLAISQIAFGGMGAVFPEPGEYRAQILSGGHVLSERRLVMLLDTPKEPLA